VRRLVLSLAVLSGCEEAAAVGSLVDHAAWMPVAAADDPLAAHRPATVDCDPAAYDHDASDLGLKLDMGKCNYLMLETPALLEVGKADPVRVELLQLEQTSQNPAVIHVAVLAGDEPLWETQLEVPGDGVPRPYETIDETVDSPVRVPSGTLIRFHLHKADLVPALQPGAVRPSGTDSYNTWHLLAIERPP
jgi:hypothetical protein